MNSKYQIISNDQNSKLKNKKENWILEFGAWVLRFNRYVIYS